MQKLRASVAQDTVQTVLEAASEISLGAIPGTTPTSKQVLPYIGRATALLDSLSATTTKELKSKALNSALMRKWPSALRHLMEDTTKPDEDWEEMLERLSEFCADAQNSLPIISALTIPILTPRPRANPLRKDLLKRCLLRLPRLRDLLVTKVKTNLRTKNKTLRSRRFEKKPRTIPTLKIFCAEAVGRSLLGLLASRASMPPRI